MNKKTIMKIGSVLFAGATIATATIATATIASRANIATEAIAIKTNNNSKFSNIKKQSTINSNFEKKDLRWLQNKLRVLEKLKSKGVKKTGIQIQINQLKERINSLKNKEIQNQKILGSKNNLDQDTKTANDVKDFLIRQVTYTELTKSAFKNTQIPVYTEVNKELLHKLGIYFDVSIFGDNIKVKVIKNVGWEHFAVTVQVGKYTTNAFNIQIVSFGNQDYSKLNSIKASGEKDSDYFRRFNYKVELEISVDELHRLMTYHGRGVSQLFGYEWGAFLALDGTGEAKNYHWVKAKEFSSLLKNAYRFKETQRAVITDSVLSNLSKEINNMWRNGEKIISVKVQYDMRYTGNGFVPSYDLLNFNYQIQKGNENIPGFNPIFPGGIGI